MLTAILAGCGQGDFVSGEDAELPPVFAEVPATCWQSGYRFSGVRLCRKSILGGHFLIEFIAQSTDTMSSIGAVQVIEALPGQPLELRYARYAGEGSLDVERWGQSDNIIWGEGFYAGPGYYETGSAVSGALENNAPCLAPINYFEGLCVDIFALDRPVARVSDNLHLVGWSEFTDMAEPSGHLSPFASLANKCWRADYRVGEAFGIYCFDALFEGSFVRLSQAIFDRHGRVDGEVFYHWGAEEMGIRYRSYNSRGQSEQGYAIAEGGRLILPGTLNTVIDGVEAELVASLVRRADDGHQLVLTDPGSIDGFEPELVVSLRGIVRAEAEALLAEEG